MSDKIDKFLNLTPIKKEPKELEVVTDKDAPLQSKYDNEDYETARAHVVDALVTMSSALGKLEDIADQSQHPRAYEALTGAAKAISSMSKELLEIKKLSTEVDRNVDRQTRPNVVNQNLFVGSTADLLDMLENKTKDDSKI